MRRSRYLRLRLEGGLVARVALPPPQAIALVGEYNSWDPKDDHWAARNDFGVWELFLPDNADGAQAIQHKCGPRKASGALDSGRLGEGGGMLEQARCETRLQGACPQRSL